MYGCTKSSCLFVTCSLSMPSLWMTSSTLLAFTPGDAVAAKISAFEEASRYISPSCAIESEPVAWCASSTIKRSMLESKIRPLRASLRITWGVAITIFASCQIFSLFTGLSFPVRVTIFSESILMNSLAILACCATNPVVGATRTIFPAPSNALAIAIHWTAVLPSPVGITSNVEPEIACLAASNWYALASTPSLRRGWDSIGVITADWEAGGQEDLH